MAFTVIYDANVLHPASLRDLLVRLATTGLFRAKWTVAILDEMVAGIIQARPDLNTERLARTRALMNKAVPDCLVDDYERLIASVELPDEGDRHVVAAAIRCHAEVIVTSNLRDFPASALIPFGIEAQSPDEFVLHLLEIGFDEVISVIATQAAALSQPPQTYDQTLDRLAQVGLSRTVAAIRHGWRSGPPEHY